MEGLYVVTVKASPPQGPEFETAGGAYINVFTTVSSESEALDIAGREVSEAGWQFDSVDGIAWVTRADYDDGDTGLEYFEQALIDGIVLVVHSYPPGGEEPNVRH
jgi:hypothetical protein